MNVVKDFIIPTVVLTVICLVVSLLLVFTYELTAPIIEQEAKRQADLARAEVMQGATSFTQVELTDEMPEGVVELYEEDSGMGYVVTTVAKGYGGDLKVMTGIKSDGTISGVKLVEHSETPGLGAKTGEEDFTSQFIGEDSSLEGVESIGGATISSTAFKTAVTTAFEAYGIASGNDVGLGPVDYKAALFPDVTEFEESQLEDSTLIRAGESGAIILASEPGYYGEPLTLAVGFDPEGTILGIVVVEDNETPGLGTKIEEPDYIAQYIGKTEVSGVEAIAGATNSSNAFKAVVEKAIRLYDTVKGA